MRYFEDTTTKMRASLVMLLAVLSGGFVLQAQEKSPTPSKEPDVVLLTNGERLVGHLENSTAAAVTFKSETAGTVTIHWDKVKELKAAGQYVVIRKDVRIGDPEALAVLPKGSVSLEGRSLEVKPPSADNAQSIPVTDLGFVVTENDFEKAIAHHGFFAGWQGGVTGGFALVEATQTNRAYNGALALSRKVPDVGWLGVRSRTIVDLSVAYAKVTQPDTPDIRTSIFHADLEQDEYFSSRVFVFGQAAFDHNFSQGLDLQQLYGGGIGFTAFRRDNQQLDLKGSFDYIRQSFSVSSNDKDLIGSQFGDTYFRKLPRGLLFNQALTATPSWNNTSAFAAIGSAGLIFPTYKRLSVSLSVADSYLHDPPAGFRKNSFQSTAGLTYTIR